MSFFDEGDEPTRVTSRPARPRRPSGGGGGSRPPRGDGGATPDRQTLLVRRGVAFGAGLVLVILLVVGVRGCLDSRAERSLKDYNRDVTAVISDSDREVGRAFFQLLGSGSQRGNEAVVSVQQLRLAADEHVGRARAFDVPGDMGAAHDKLLLVLNLRAGALRKIAERLPAAYGDGQPADQAVKQITGEMQAFLSSDVVYKLRVAPLIKEALDDNGIEGQTISDTRFLPSVAWLSEATVGQRLGAGSGGTTGADGQVTPGLHGHGLASVAVGPTTLQPSPNINRIQAGADGVIFTVRFANQGDNDERSVRVNVRLKGGGANIPARRTIPQTKAGSPTEVSIPLGKTPPFGSAVTVDVSIAAVPGEKKTDNNKQSYTILFQR